MSRILGGAIKNVRFTIDIHLSRVGAIRFE
jgi:hypothetical protein